MWSHVASTTPTVLCFFRLEHRLRSGPVVTDTSAALAVLLVEDNPADADLVRELLGVSLRTRYDVVVTSTFAAALEVVAARRFDVVLIDLRLPDQTGVDSVTKLRPLVGATPIVVLTGLDDEALAMACIDAGAQDYLVKGDLRPLALQRAVAYAMGRVRQVASREDSDLIAKYARLSTEAYRGSVTASLSGQAAIAERQPAVFRHIVEEYVQLLPRYFDHVVRHREKPRDAMVRLATRLGDYDAGPRDLVDAHMAALGRIAGDESGPRARALTHEGRLAVLEMMGLLVDYYRVGQR